MSKERKIDVERVVSWVAEHMDETVALLSDLVACRTVNPPGDEHLAAAVVTSFLDRFSIPWRTYEKEKGRTNVVAVLGSGSPNLLMAAHMDVVPPGDGWETDPFTLTVRDGRMFARGVMDDKGPLAGILTAARFFAENPSELPCTLTVVAAADEEQGSALGLKYLVAEGLIEPDFVLIGDIAGHCLEIDVAEKGVLQFELAAKGRQAHAAVPHEGRNAIYAMCDWIRRIRAAKLPGEAHPYLSPPTVNIGKISGGIAPNVVPGECRAVLDMRVLPGTDPEMIRSLLLNLASLDSDRNPDITFSAERIGWLPPTELPLPSPGLDALQRAIRAVKRKRPKLIGSGGATDCKAFIAAGIPAVAFGPGDENVAHLANEYLDIEELADFTAIAIAFAADFA